MRAPHNRQAQHFNHSYGTLTVACTCVREIGRGLAVYEHALLSCMIATASSTPLQCTIKASGQTCCEAAGCSCCLVGQALLPHRWAALPDPAAA
jgi:hypothetical protein